MHQALSLLLVSVIAVQASPVSAQVVTEGPNPPALDQPTLQERLNNIPAEAERFLESRAPKDWAVRYMIQDIPTNTPIEVLLRNGGTAVGRIKAIDQDGFTLEPGNYVTYCEVRSVQTQLSNTTHYKRDFILLGVIVGAVILVTYIVLSQHGN